MGKTFSRRIMCRCCQRIAAAICVALVLTACSADDSAAPEKPADRGAKKKTDALDKARGVSDQLDQAARRQRDATQ